MGFGVGAVPSRVTLPVTDPAVAGSTGAAGAAAPAAGVSEVSVACLLPQPASAMASAAVQIANDHLVVMIRKCLLGRIVVKKLELAGLSLSTDKPISNHTPTGSVKLPTLKNYFPPPGAFEAAGVLPASAPCSCGVSSNR